MKKFLLISLFILTHFSVYSDQDINNLNNLLKQSGSFSNSSSEKPKIEAKIDYIEKNSIKEKDLFSEPEKTYKNKELADFNNFLKKNNDFHKIAEYLSKNIKDMDKQNADEMILMFEKYYYSIPLDTEVFIKDEELIDKKFGSLILEEGKKYNNDYAVLIKNYNSVENVELKDYLKSLYDRNLNLTYSNGYFFFTVNYNKLQIFDKYLSDSMINYLKYSDNEIRNPAVSDSKIVITMNELTDRILNAENYIKSSDNKELNKEFAKMLVFHFENLMLGVGNSPVFNYETGIINEDFLNTYKYYISKNGLFKADMQDFLNYLEKNKFSKSTDTYSKQINVTNKVTNFYQLKKEETFQ